MMKVTRLSWAGLLIQSDSTNILIDPLQNISEQMISFLGAPKEQIMEIPGNIGNPHVFITHIHPDHFDLETVNYLINDSSTFYGPKDVVEASKKEGLTGIVPTLYEPILAGKLTVTAVPAVDWVGDEQVSWVISDGTTRIFHGGDTGWHGYWWKFEKKFGPFDTVFLPVNGITGQVPGIDSASDIPGSLTPKEAVTAAKILKAKKLVPIHYDLFNNPPFYIQYPDLHEILEMESCRQKIAIYYMKAGDVTELYGYLHY
jgi:L-ascorbate metabolism protein UlaG (beta-lactamase superfamily)